MDDNCFYTASYYRYKGNYYQAGSTFGSEGGRSIVEAALAWGLPDLGAPGAPKALGTVSQEIQSLGQLQGKSGAGIAAKLKAEGYSPVTANNGGTIWTKAGGDGNTSVVRVDPAMVRTDPRGFADEVPHIHKEIVPTNKVTNGNYSPSDATKLNDLGVPSTDPRQTHIPGEQ